MASEDVSRLCMLATLVVIFYSLLTDCSSIAYKYPNCHLLGRDSLGNTVSVQRHLHPGLRLLSALGVGLVILPKFAKAQARAEGESSLAAPSQY